MWKVTIHKKKKMINPILIEGLPGIANVGKIVADYMIEQHGAQKIMSLFSYNLPNSVFVGENNLVELPRIEIFHKKIGGKDFLFLAGDVQPVSEESSYTFSEKILDIVEKMGCKEIVTLGGIGLSEVPDNPKVYCTGNDSMLIKKFTAKGAKENIYGMVGPIIGVSGLLVGLSQQRKIKSVALLAETYGHPMYLGLKGAKASLKILIKVYDQKINFKDIDKEIKSIDKENGNERSEQESQSLRRLKKMKDTTYLG